MDLISAMDAFWPKFGLMYEHGQIYSTCFYSTVLFSLQLWQKSLFGSDQTLLVSGYFGCQKLQNLFFLRTK